MKKWILCLSVILSPASWAVESICLESAANQAISRLDGDFHLVRSSPTGSVVSLVNLLGPGGRSETFSLAYVGTLEGGQEFLSFESYDKLINLFATPLPAGGCSLDRIEQSAHDGGTP